MSDVYDYTLWKGDSDILEVKLADRNGALDLSNAEITAILEGFSGSPSYTVSCTGNNVGVVTVSLTSVETAVAGRYYIWFEVTIAGKKVTFPSLGPRKIKIFGT